MLPTTLAEIDNASIGAFAQAATVILMLVLVGMQLLRGATGKDGERQIEPTALHAITNELKTQTVTLNKLDRESEGTRVSIDHVKHELTRLRDDVTKETENQFKRINAISAESTATKTRVEILERSR